MSRGVGFAVVAQSLLHNAEENESAASAAAAAAIDEGDAPTRSHEVHVPDVADRVLRNLAEDTVRRIDLDENTMPENLPALTAPELKLIGRCVCFGMKQTINGVASVYYYTGLVTAVTAAAVTLMHVNRYTESDFKAYKERERKASGRHHHSSNTGDDDDAAAANEPLDFPATDCTAGSLVLTGDVPRLTARESVGMTDDVTHFPYSLSDVFSASGFGAALGQPKDARGSLCPAVKMITGEELENLSVHHHHHHSGDTRGTQVDSNGSDRSTAASATVHAASLRTCRDSLGPLPCATFLRKAIHDVKFGRAPENTFYNLFHDPSKSLMDMQYLRMFVRRYLVHTAENNNPRRLPLRRYVVKHGACPSVAWAEVEAVAREELLALMKVDRAIAKEKRRMRTRNARREEAIRDYRAPPGLFAGTGFLYLTGLPQGSLLAAATLLFFTLAFGFNFVLTVQVFGEGLTQWIFRELSDYVTAALVIWMATSFLTAYHALAMRVPSLANAPVLVLRGMFSVASAVYAIACMAVISQCASNDYLYESMKRSPADALCGFYETHQCSGFYRSCGSALMQDNSICLNCVPMVVSPTPCYTAITEQLQRVVIPLFLFSIVIFLGSVHGLFLLLRLFLVARAASLTSGI